MYNIKEDKVDDTFVSSIKEQENYYNEKYTVCGKDNSSEIKTLVKYDLSNVKEIAAIDNNIEKIELCMFLIEVKLDKHMKEMIINVGENVENFKCNTVTYNNVPRVKQKQSFYVLKPEFKNEYVSFDITSMIKEYKTYEENFGISILPISYGGFAYFGSSKSEKKPYLKIYYKNEEKNSLPENTSKDIHGLFINNTGQIQYDEDVDFIVWNQGYHLSGMDVDGNNFKIIIKEPGVYQIDCSINIRTQTSTYMSIFINEKEVTYSRIFLGVTEQQSTGQNLINIDEQNASIQVGIKKSKMMLVNNGVAASLRIIKI